MLIDMLWELSAKLEDPVRIWRKDIRDDINEILKQHQIEDIKHIAAYNELDALYKRLNRLENRSLWQRIWNK